MVFKIPIKMIPKQKVPLILGLGNHDVGLNGNSHREVKLSENSALPMTLTFFP